MSILHHLQEIIISQNLTRLHDRDHAHLRDYLSIRRLILHVYETLHCRSVLVGKVGHLHHWLIIGSMSENGLANGWQLVGCNASNVTKIY